MSSRATVLVVDDDVLLMRVLSVALSRAGYHVLTAARADRALTIAAIYDGAIHAVLLDLRSPEMPIRDVIEEINRIRPRTRIIGMSGDVTKWGQGLAEEGVILLAKPFGPSTLANAVGDALSWDLDRHERGCGGGSIGGRR